MSPRLGTLLVVPLVLVLLAGTTGAALPPTFTLHTHNGALGLNAGEPSIGINRDTGVLLAQAGSQTLRVVFDDSTTPATATWTNIYPFRAAVVGVQLPNVDPILTTDVSTGRTWAGGLEGECSILAFTDDDGATWTPAGNACAAPSFDHPSIGAGPMRAPKVDALYPGVTYYCAQTSVTQCSTSYDGGLTFGPGVPVTCGYVNPGLVGRVEVGADGYAYLPVRNCGGVNGFAVSSSNGLTWTGRPIPGATTPDNGFDPSVAPTPGNWAYVAYQEASGAIEVVLTKDHGLTFGPAKDVTASVGVKTGTFPHIIAGDDDRAAVAFLGTTTAGDAFAPSFAGTWDLYVATTYDAGASWSTQKVTTDPVQRGWICAGGFNGCSSGRNLLDFNDMRMDGQGRVYAAFADGCINACALPGGTAAQSTSAKLVIARQSGGTCLLAVVCG